MDNPPPISLLYAGIHGVCPRCGIGHVFHNILDIVEACPHCQLNLSELDTGDGPAFLAIVLVGGIITALAGVVELAFSPPFWVHALLWIPLILVASILTLRIFKAALLASQYHTKRLNKS